MRTHRVFAIAECAQLSRVIPGTPPVGVMGVAGLLAALVLAAVGWASLTEADLVVRAPARVRASTAPAVAFTASTGDRVTAAIGGRVAAVLVRDGAKVRAGDPLATLDTAQLANDVARLEAGALAARQARDATVRMAELARAEFEAAQATRDAELAQVAHDEWRARSRRLTDIALARSAFDSAERELARVRALVSDGAASQTQLELATAKQAERRAELGAAAVAAAGGRAEVLRRQRTQAERELAVRTEERAQLLARQTAELEAMDRQLANTQLELAKGTIRAETAGVIGGVSVAAGELVQPGRELFVIAPEAGLRVDAAVAVADVGRLQPGMPVRLRFDAFDWQRYGTVTGTIDQISPDAAPIAAGQALVYTVRIALATEQVGTGELKGQLKLGMTGTAEVITGRQGLLSLLLGRMHSAFSLGGS